LVFIKKSTADEGGKPKSMWGRFANSLSGKKDGMVVNTVTLGDPTAAAACKKIAEGTGGEYSHQDV
jgi:hypothetical protein